MSHLRWLFVVCYFTLLISLEAQTTLKACQLYPKELMANPTRVRPPMLLKNNLIVIDPGHGGHDIGTQSISKPRYQEKYLNLITAKFVQTYLAQAGFDVMMTREEDVFISLEKRAQIANEKQPYLFVSIHYNSAPSAEAQGIEVYYYLSKENKSRTLKSKRLSQSVLRQVLKTTDANSRGVKAGNFLVIRETTVPAILIEGGFVSNEEELHRLKNPDYLKKIAWGIVKGIEEYVKSGR